MRTLPARFAGMLAVAAWCLLPGLARAQTRYHLVDLGTLGGPQSAGFSLSATGLAVGSADTATGEAHAFSFAFPGGPRSDLGTLGGPQSAAFGVNDAGTIVGEAQDGVGDTHAFVFSGGMSDLATLGGDISSSARGINAAGAIVGVSTDASGNAHAFLWSGGPMSDLGTLGGDTEAFGINDAGVAVGHSFNGADRRAFRWDESGGMTDLLGALADGESAAWGIADDFVVGEFTTAIGDTHAFRYRLSDGAFEDLDTLGGVSSIAFAVNGSGAVVGTSALRAFLWTTAQGIIDLNDALDANPSGVQLTEARGINDDGAILANGFIGEDRHAFLLFAVNAPEPMSLCLLPLGTIAFAWRRRAA